MVKRFWIEERRAVLPELFQVVIPQRPGHGLGLQNVAENLPAAGEAIQKLRWRLRMRTGCDPMNAKIPKRYTEVVTWKGPIDTAYMEELRRTYAARLLELGREEGL